MDRVEHHKSLDPLIVLSSLKMVVGGNINWTNSTKIFEFLLELRDGCSFRSFYNRKWATAMLPYVMFESWDYHPEVENWQFFYDFI